MRGGSKWQTILNKLIDEDIERVGELYEFEEIARENPENLILWARYAGLLHHHKLFADMPPVLNILDRFQPYTALSFYFRALTNIEIDIHNDNKELFKKFYIDFFNKKKDPIIKLYEAKFFRKLGDYTKAIALLDEYIDSITNPQERGNDLEVILDQAQIFLETGDFGKAFELLDENLVKDPNSYKLNLYKVFALRGLNNNKDALSILNKLLSITTSPRRKALLHIETARSRKETELEAKLNDLEESRKLNPGIEVEREVIISYYMANKLKEAESLLENYEKSCMIGNDYPMLLIKASIFRHLKKNPGVAVYLYGRLLSLAPDTQKDYFKKQIKKMLEISRSSVDFKKRKIQRARKRR